LIDVTAGSANVPGIATVFATFTADPGTAFYGHWTSMELMATEVMPRVNMAIGSAPAPAREAANA